MRGAKNKSLSDAVRPTDEQEGKAKKVEHYLEGGRSQSGGFFDKELDERLGPEALVEALILEAIGRIINRRWASVNQPFRRIQS